MMEYQFTSPNNDNFVSIWNGYKDEDVLEKVEVGKDAKECFAKKGEYRKMQDRLWGSNDAFGFPRSEEDYERTQKQVLQDHVPRNHGT